MDTHLLWCSGFFDGEGSVTINKAGFIQLGIANTNRASLEHFAKRLSCKLYCLKSKPGKTKDRRPAYLLQPFGSEAIRVLRELEPYCCVKRRQIKTALTFAEDGNLKRWRPHLMRLNGKWATPLPEDPRDGNIIKKMSDEELRGYVSGFFDGEGNIVVSFAPSPRGPVHTLRVTVAANTHHSSILALQECIGGGTSRISPPQGSLWKPAIMLVLGWKRGFEFLRWIEPLVVVKKSVVELALKFCGIKKKLKKKPASRTDFEHMERIRLAIRKTNDSWRSAKEVPRGGLAAPSENA